MAGGAVGGKAAWGSQSPGSVPSESGSVANGSGISSGRLEPNMAPIGLGTADAAAKAVAVAASTAADSGLVNAPMDAARCMRSVAASSSSILLTVNESTATPSIVEKAEAFTMSMPRQPRLEEMAPSEPRRS